MAGGCVPVGDGALPYAPIVEALRALLGDLGADAMRGLVGPSWPEIARLVPALGESDRSGLSDQITQARLFELLLGLFGRLSVQEPLVLVVEDLHWADRSTRELLAFLIRNLRRERLLLVMTYRNDEPGQQRLGPYLAELDRAGRWSVSSLLGWIRSRRGHSWSASSAQRQPPSWSMPCSPAQRAIPSSLRNCWRPCGTDRRSCPRPCTISSAAGCRRCPSRLSMPSGWWRWPAGLCRTGCWPRSPGWTTRTWTWRFGPGSPPASGHPATPGRL